jgi:hypothetical protein
MVCLIPALLLAAAIVLGCELAPLRTGDRISSTSTFRGGSQEVRLAGEIVSGELSDPATSRCTEPWRYEDSLTGGHIFQMYCGACHNARALGERPFASYENATNHMRVRANLTGEEYRKLMVFLRYWHVIPPQTRPVEPSPKRFIFSQPISELRPDKPSPQAEVPQSEPGPH